MNVRTLKLAAGLMLGLAILLYAGYFLVYVRYAAALISFPFDYDQGEGFELNDSVLFARGEWPYRSNEVFPFYASNYPPLYHVWFVPFVWLFGPALWYGRLFSFLSTLVTAGALGYAVHRATGDRTMSLFSALAFLSSNYVYHIGPLFRQHISMVMFETLAIVILAPLSAATTPRDIRRVALGLACLLAAGYTKQLAYATILVSLAFLAWRNWRLSVAAAALFGVVAAALFGLINLVTGGQWWVNIILANINEFMPGQMEGLFLQWYDLHQVLIWMAILFTILVATRFLNRPDAAYHLYGLWFVGATANATLSGKWGAGESYFMTSIAAMCLCAGLLLAEWRRAASGQPAAQRWATAFLIPVLLIVQAGRLIHLPTQGRLFEPIARLLNLPVDSAYYDSQGYTQLGRPPNSIDVAQGHRILAHVRAADGPVMTEEATFALLAGKEQVGNPTQLLNLAKNNLLDSSAMIAMIEARAFDLIVLKAEFYPRPVLAAIGQNYQSVETIVMNGFAYRILEPRPAHAP